MVSSNTGRAEEVNRGNGGTKSLSLAASRKTVDLVIDLQYGSTGKGLLCGYLADSWGCYDTVITANMPNAGHTYINARGDKYVFKALPTSAVGLGVKRIMIGPGAVFDLRRLLEEMAHLRKGQRVLIHPNAMVLSPEHKTMEQKRLTHVASTTQGSAAAVIEKMWRQGSASTAKEILGNSKFSELVASPASWRFALEDADRILAEGSQGYSLGINTQFYPYTTSRDCTPAAFLSAMGIPVGWLDRVFGTCRTLPIRVGGTSGPHYPDQEELSWHQLKLTPERTTVTNRERRIFTYSKMQMEESCFYCQPDLVFVNFANYVSKEYMSNVVAHIDQMSTVRWVGFGPGYNDVGVI